MSLSSDCLLCKHACNAGIGAQLSNRVTIPISDGFSFLAQICELGCGHSVDLDEGVLQGTTRNGVEDVSDKRRIRRLLSVRKYMSPPFALRQFPED